MKQKLIALARAPRWLVYSCMSLLLLTIPVRSQPMKDSDRDQEAIRSVIEQQLQAFQQDNASAAFSFASPGIRAKFGTPQDFLRMVQVTYPSVYRPRSVMFERLGLVNGLLAQELLLLDPAGKLVRALYVMEKQPDGSWKIGGCYLVPVEADGEVI